jgi:hypothetical protein
MAARAIDYGFFLWFSGKEVTFEIRIRVTSLGGPFCFSIASHIALSTCVSKSLCRPYFANCNLFVDFISNVVFNDGLRPSFELFCKSSQPSSIFSRLRWETPQGNEIEVENKKQKVTGGWKLSIEKGVKKRSGKIGLICQLRGVYFPTGAWHVEVSQPLPENWDVAR